jgi:hypothetical protein
MLYKKNVIIIVLLLSAVVFGAATMSKEQQGPQQPGPQQQQQNQEPPKNLKVLPKNITRPQLDSLMRSFRLALGVRCNFCHVSLPGTPPKMDYASDEKKEKVRARGMIKMMLAINKKYFDKKGSITTTALNVTCASCHNGKQKPITSL